MKVLKWNQAGEFHRENSGRWFSTKVRTSSCFGKSSGF